MDYNRLIGVAHAKVTNEKQTERLAMQVGNRVVWTKLQRMFASCGGPKAVRALASSPVALPAPVALPCDNRPCPPRKQPGRRFQSTSAPVCPPTPRKQPGRRFQLVSQLPPVAEEAEEEAVPASAPASAPITECPSAPRKRRHGYQSLQPLRRMRPRTLAMTA